MKEAHGKVQVVVLHNENNKLNLLLLQTKIDRGEFWQNVTGSVEGDEGWSDAAKRELLEETGLSGKLTKLSLCYNFHDRWQRDVQEKTFMALVTSSRVRLCEIEHQAYKWLPIEEVRPDHFGHESNYQTFMEACKCLK